MNKTIINIEHKGFIANGVYNETSYQEIVTPDNLHFYHSISNAIEQALEDFVYGFEQCDLREYGKAFGYDKIETEVYEIIDKVLANKWSKDGLCVKPENYDTVVQMLHDDIDYRELYEIIDNIYDAPITMAEKLADIGMSYTDFL